ncbi:MAG: Rieske 2Fe-2S domain-containing protein [Chloroflexi bacterium]|nr:Rieske 2Fe-2S domain-containing protein [Chloroflexota bacterium]
MWGGNRMIADADSIGTLVDKERGLVSREIFLSEEIYQQELEQIFARAWLFVGHESQIPNPGDFVLSRMGDEPVIVVRDRNRRVHVFLNSCRHRGNRVCRYDQGNTSVFTCTFHGWTYDLEGKLTALPFHDGGYNDLDKPAWGLWEARSELFEGSIWGCWDESAPDFREYLGGTELYLSALLRSIDGTPGGAEVLGGVQKWRIPCNWKVPSPDTDRTHGWITHKSVDAVNIAPSGQGRRDRSDRGQSYTVNFPEGHTMSMTLPREDAQPYRGSWASTPIVGEYLDHAYQERKKKMGALASTQCAPGIFPNAGSQGGQPWVIRIMHPQGPTTTEIWSYFLIDRDAPREVKEIIRDYYGRYAGPGGMTQQDDMENWHWSTAASKGTISRRLPYNYQLFVDEQPLHGPSNFGLPGLFCSITSDENHRRYYQRWAEFMAAKSWDELRVHEHVK